MMSRLLRRPELGALVGAIVVGVFFWAQSPLFLQLDGIANWIDVASTLGIMAVAVALLMIGGEFDLSAGVMTGSAGLMMGILATEVRHEHVVGDRARRWSRALAVGFLNGYMVMRTRLPSFIVTLGTFFILQGVNLGVTKAITDQVPVSGHRRGAGLRAAPNKIFGGSSGRRTTSGSPCCGGSLITALGDVGAHAHARRQLDLRRRRRRQRRPQRRRPGRAREDRAVHDDVVRRAR